MADSEKESSLPDCGTSSDSSECACNTLSTRSSTNTDDDLDFVKSGWLLKRSRLSKRWKKRWFTLQRTELVYGDDPQMSKTRSIPLDGTGISNASLDSMPNTFKLKPRGKRRTFYVQAETSIDQQEWMEALCFAKAASHEKDSGLCAIQ